MKHQDVVKAYQLGKQAFGDGKNATPDTDPALVELLTTHNDDGGLKFQMKKAWTDGWSVARTTGK